MNETDRQLAEAWAPISANLRTKPLPSGRQSRQCLSCARALRRVHYHRKVNGIKLDMKILSDAKYAQIMERAA